MILLLDENQRKRICRRAGMHKEYIHRGSVGIIEVSGGKGGIFNCRQHNEIKI